MKSAFIDQTYERGIALVLTLAILAIATILVVGFVTSMRTERQAAASMSNNASAAIFQSFPPKAPGISNKTQ